MRTRILTAGLLAAGLMLSAAPAAPAEPMPVPDPAPAPEPVPGAPLASAGTECANGEVMQDGNCVPKMSPVAGDTGQPANAPLRETQTETTSITTGVGANEVPNLNGYPCTGDFQSMACIAAGNADMPAVQPRSTLSSSP